MTLTGVGAIPGLWTLDWTHGLDCGLILGLGFSLTQSAITTITYHAISGDEPRAELS